MVKKSLFVKAALIACCMLKLSAEQQATFNKKAFVEKNYQTLLKDFAQKSVLECDFIENTKDIDEKNIESLTFSPCGNYLLVGAGAHGAILVELASGNKKNLYQQHVLPTVTSVAFNNDGTTAIVGRDLGVDFFTITSFDNIIKSATQELEQQPCSLATCGQGCCTYVGAAQLHYLFRDVTNNSDQEQLTSFSLNTPGSLLYSVACHPGGKFLLANASDHTSYFFNLSSGSTVTLSGEGVIRCSAFIPNTQQYVVGSDDHTVTIVNFDGSSAKTLTHDSAVTAIACSPEGEYIFSGTEDGILALWKHETDQVLAVSLGKPINAISGNVAGKWLAVATGDTVHLIPTIDYFAQEMSEQELQEVRTPTTN
ncbi:MAG: hypothetical protein H6679_05900 [Epsilonproteobacteria bacterium]|nr:hypothetical protein [Campylobacterota bacterium]